jgi:hypothetical protein
MKLTAGERKAKRCFEREIRRWRRILLIDPIWTFQVSIAADEDMEQGDANVDIGTSEYYLARINISRGMLSLENGELEMAATNVACHELLHIATADYQRAALVAAGDNAQMQEELRYRYEQLVSRFSMILMGFDSQLEEETKDEPVCTEGTKSTEEVLRVPEVPTGEEDS